MSGPEDPRAGLLSDGRHLVTANAVIFGPEGPELSVSEAAFFRDAAPWGFILFARNIASPEQVSHLTGALRESVGRDAPILVDQEGGRVARLGPPHWRRWGRVTSLFDGVDEGPAVEAARLRYRIIAEELRTIGIDVNCMPLLDVPMPEVHEIIGSRVLGSAPDDIARRGRAVCEGLLAGGVLPVIKHMPGHGRATLDTHIALPRVTTPLEELDATDFAPFRALTDQVLGMTAHVVFEAIDPDRCATLSPAVIGEIRGRIGFDGLLMSDDLSMAALTGPIGARAAAALEAGCDVALHCNGALTEMVDVAGYVGPLQGHAARRATLAETARQAPEPIDLAAAEARYQLLTGEDVHV